MSNKRLKFVHDIESNVPCTVTDHCNVCPLAKQKRLSFPLSRSYSISCFDLIHIDIWGPYKMPTVHNEHYFLTIVDDCSCYTWLFLMKNKSETRSLIKSFYHFVETQFSVRIKTIRTDNGLEFNMSEFYASKGIAHQTTCTYTPEQNGIVERKHQHILSVARSLKIQSGISLSY